MSPMTLSCELCKIDDVAVNKNQLRGDTNGYANKKGYY